MMKHIKITGFSLAATLLLVSYGQSLRAKENVGISGNGNKGVAVASANCNPTTAQVDLDINNVRTTILVGGDMWWDLDNAKYEVPKGSNKHSVFAGALWIGGIDAGGQVKVAAQTYRQTGVDFWGGPIDTSVVNITQEKCTFYDRHWVVSKKGVNAFRTGDLSNPELTTQIANAIEEWPGNGEGNEAQYLAPFFDNAGDGTYDPADGDYPKYDYSPPVPNVPGVITTCNDFLFGDRTIWWVFNDVGNAHTETSSDPIGMEIRAQAFGFETNDEINNMTFYKYQIINRSSLTLTETYFGQWVDPDLGNAVDDYVGCDVPRGLGFCYNGDADDETGSGYGMNPPSVGVDFFQGPTADLNDGVDNDRDGCIDCTFLDSVNSVLTIDDDDFPEQIIMSKFVYYNNVNNSPIGNPNGFADFYNYLRGIWLDNQPITYGADGRDPSAPVCDFMFPGTTDPINFPLLGEWSEFTAGNVPEDRRFLQSAGTFTLTPGAVNYITTGVVWARATQGGPLASVDLMKLADDKAQALFVNCFRLIDGPDAPNLAIRELDKQLIVSIQDYDTTSVERYAQIDPTIVGVDDSLKVFTYQGYQVFQLKDGSVSTADIGDPDKVRLLYQVDVVDSVGQLVNFEYDPSINANIPTEMVNGADQGIRHTFVVDQDLFATGSTQLVNNKTYYYTIVSYAFNQYKKYDPNDPSALDGQKKPYLAGRNNIKTYSAIPHIPSVENNGQIFQSDYATGPMIKRLEGQGNGGMLLNFAPQHAASYESQLLNPPYRILEPEYTHGQGPINVRVYDPSIVDPGSFEVRFDGIMDTAQYTVSNFTTSYVVPSERTITQHNEQVYPEWGLTSTINQVIEAGKAGAVDNALLGSSMQYENPDNQWLSWVVDVDGTDPNAPDPEDWIRSGTDYLYAGLDDEEFYENVAGGSWAPYKLTYKAYPGPKFPQIAEPQIQLSPQGNSRTGIASVNIYITADKSKWTRCPVIEMGGGTSGVGTVGSAKAFDLRRSPSIGKNGEPDASINSFGMSYFPGYAVNLETGERLNMAFGENSMFGDQNSQDLKFNPTSNRYNDIVPPEPVFGGMHYIFVFGHNGDNTANVNVNGTPTPILADVSMYDEGKSLVDLLLLGSGDYPGGGTTANSVAKRNAWKDCMYTSIPVRAAGNYYANLNLPDQIPADGDIRVAIRIARSYRTYATAPIINATQPLTIGTTYYVAQPPVIHNNDTFLLAGESFVAATTNFVGTTGTSGVVGSVTTSVPKNNFNPLYTFGTGDLANITNNSDVAQDALDLINVVPNPYYAFSSYETSQLDNRIKITNLPPKCTVSIFTVNGTLVRKFKRDVSSDNSAGEVFSTATTNAETSIDWDLKNHKNIPIASGMYLIHVEAPGLGERTLKWFGMIRPIDLDTF